jgi:hypothetical protein
MIGEGTVFEMTCSIASIIGFGKMIAILLVGKCFSKQTK